MFHCLLLLRLKKPCPGDAIFVGGSLTPRMMKTFGQAIGFGCGGGTGMVGIGSVCLSCGTCAHTMLVCMPVLWLVAEAGLPT